MLRALTLMLSLAFVAPVPAAQFEPASRYEGSDFLGAGFALARVEQVIELVRATREIPVSAYEGVKLSSELRVSLVVLDNGPATDVSPRLDLQLALFNEISEYGTAWGLEPVASVYAFQGVERTAAGIYEVTATILSGTDSSECYFQKANLRIDARALSVAVRRANGMEEFEAKRYTADMPVTVTALGCAESPY